MNILHRTTSEPLEINILAQKALRWPSGFLDPENGVSLGIM